MIVGIGIDIVAVDRVDRLLEGYGGRFLRRCFDEEEIQRRSDAEHLAGLLAGKEAGYKALHADRGSGIGWHEIVVTRDGNSRRPKLKLRGRADAWARRLDVHRSHLSISHQGGLAVAVVILEA